MTEYGAGVLFVSPQGVLLVENQEGLWEFPGGGGESWDDGVWGTARREVREEVGVRLPPRAPDVKHFIAHDKDFAYVTFVIETDSFRPLLSKEHKEFVWQPAQSALDHLQLHPGVRQVLEAL